jgi:glycosyltransferase involved in cell wall biosynthesis
MVPLAPGQIGKTGDGMRVGLFDGVQNPESGGGHVFARELFESLLNYADQTKHQFVLFSWSGLASQPKPSFSNVEYVHLKRGSGERLRSRLMELSRAMRRKFRYPFRRFIIESGYQKFVLRNMVRYRIDLLWHMGPGCITADLPYITTVWDLQHRLQAFFPEVSTEGEWQGREDTYATSLRRAAIVLTGTEAGKAEIERFYQVPPDRIRVLPLPTPKFAIEAAGEGGQDTLAKFDLQKDYLYYPAQFWPHKNHTGLLVALKFLREKHNLLFDMVFVGSDKGNTRHARQVAKDLNLSQHVHFLGFVTEQELVALYRNAFALTFVSYFGPDNIPPLEAFALGCPVIASKVPGAEEQLGDAALLVDPKDPQQIAATIRLLHDSPALRADLVQRGRKRALRFTGRDYVEGIFAILDEFEPIRRCWSNTELYHQG